MSDLQCPARLFVGRPTSQEQAGAWARKLAGRGVVTQVDLRAGAPAIGSVADVHRGESVLVLVAEAPRALPSLGEGRLVACEVDADGLRIVPEAGAMPEGEDLG